MTSIADLVEDIELKYLEPVTEEAPSVPLAADMTDSAGSFTILDGVLSPDEESLIGPGALLELDYELVRVTDYDASTHTITCQRGRRRTTPAAHTAASTEMRSPTRWPRNLIAKAISSSIRALWQPLFAVREERIVTDVAGYLTLPLAAVAILSVEYQEENSRWTTADYHFFPTHPLDEGSAGLQLDIAVRPGALCNVKWGQQIVVPTTYTAEIEYLPEHWERIIEADVGAELLSGVDIDAVTQEVLTQQLRLERFPVRSGSNISTSLIRYREYLVEQAKSEIDAQYPRGIEMMPVNYVM